MPNGTLPVGKRSLLLCLAFVVPELKRYFVPQVQAGFACYPQGFICMASLAIERRYAVIACYDKER
ncbi:MAG TPA: hypothetical protein VFP71_00205 [Candidatus Angelobacter sp.]|nr:hypothetical protein [Candidatus Angelobacter sp.]